MISCLCPVKFGSYASWTLVFNTLKAGLISKNIIKRRFSSTFIQKCYFKMRLRVYFMYSQGIMLRIVLCFGSNQYFICLLVHPIKLMYFAVVWDRSMQYRLYKCLFKSFWSSRSSPCQCNGPGLWLGRPLQVYIVSTLFSHTHIYIMIHHPQALVVSYSVAGVWQCWYSTNLLFNWRSLAVSYPGWTVHRQLLTSSKSSWLIVFEYGFTGN